MYSFSSGWRAICLVSLLVVDKVHCFQPSSLHHHGFTRNNRSLLTSSVRSTPPFVTRSGTTTTSSLASSKSNVEPQAIGTGYSQSPDLYTAIQEATDAALQALPKPLPQNKIDLGTIYVTSLYDNQFSPSQVVPAVLAECNNFYESSDNIVQKLVGCYSGGIVGSKLNYKGNASSNGISTENDNKNNSKVSSTMESEGMPGVVVTLCVLPDTNIKTFHVLGEDVPEDMGRMDLNMWKNSIGLKNFNDAASAEGQADKPTFMLLPSPSFQNDLDDFMRTMKMCFGPDQTIFGALASTVSSLSRARLFRFDVDEPGCLQTLADGCIGVAMTGDVKFNVMVAQGAKPVGGIYRVVAGMESTIGAIQLDEFATKQLEEEMDGEDEEEDDDDDGSENDAEKRKKFNAAQYAKAIIPKPVLAEANYIMKTLSDDDQAFMRKSLLIGLERGGGISKTPNELLRLAEGKGHSFQVIQVASAGMKDGSITLPLGSVDVQRGARLRFFVRDGGFAKREIEALWIGYKKRALEQSLFASSSASDDDDDDEDSSSDVFNPAGCFFFPTLDRGTKFFGESSFESSAISDYAPSLPSISGFFCNGAIASLDTIENKPMVHGSASCYVLIGSKSNRPVYSAEAKAQQDSKSEDEAKSEADDANNDGDDAASDILNNEDQPAPRSEDGELIVRRREIHSGRALTVSNVEWSVVENTATPTSALEGFMWEKETEVDRLRERVPLSNLVSQCKLYDIDPSKPKPRDWVGAFQNAAKETDFVVIPELKRLEPKTGSLRKRYDLFKLTKQMVAADSPVVSINCDGVLFGGSMDEVTALREKISSVMLESSMNAEDGVLPVPILSSDLILYPYQLYKLRLAGTDAVQIIVGALASKDLLYLTKIASTLKLQIVASVTSEVQIRALNKLSIGSIQALVVSNRDLETFGFDESGDQALALLGSEALKEFKDKFGDDVPILVEGRVGIIEKNGSSQEYVKALKGAGADGAIVGSGLVSPDGKEDIATAVRTLQEA